MTPEYWATLTDLERALVTALKEKTKEDTDKVLWKMLKKYSDQYNKIKEQLT